MPLLITDPQVRIAEQPGRDEMLGTDPYALGFCVMDYSNNGRHEVAVYDLGEGVLAYFSFNTAFGHALVIQRNGIEVFAGAVTDEADARGRASEFLS